MMGKATTLMAFATAALLTPAAGAQGQSSGQDQRPAAGPAHKAPVRLLDRRLPTGGVKTDDDDPFSGRLLGRGYQQGTIEAGAELKLEQQFLAGQPALVALLAADAPLALTVAEPGAGRTCRSARGCRWLPEYTQRYAITLHNRSGARVRYVLLLK